MGHHKKTACISILTFFASTTMHLYAESDKFKGKVCTSPALSLWFNYNLSVELSQVSWVLDCTLNCCYTLNSASTVLLGHFFLQNTFYAAHSRWNTKVQVIFHMIFDSTQWVININGHLSSELLTFQLIKILYYRHSGFIFSFINPFISKWQT